MTFHYVRSDCRHAVTMQRFLETLQRTNAPVSDDALEVWETEHLVVCRFCNPDADDLNDQPEVPMLKKP